MVPESEEFGVTSFVFRARRPFHPGRLKRRLEEGLPRCLRSKGTAWLAHRSEWAVEWSSAGSLFALVPVARWLAEVPRAQWRCDVAEALKDFDGPFGDRRQVPEPPKNQQPRLGF